MPRLKAKIKYNDDIWREEYLLTDSFEMYADLQHFKALGYILDFKLFLVKNVNNKTMEIDIEEILGGSSGVHP